MEAVVVQVLTTNPAMRSRISRIIKSREIGKIASKMREIAAWGDLDSDGVVGIAIERNILISLD